MDIGKKKEKNKTEIPLFVAENDGGILHHINIKKGIGIFRIIYQ